MESVHPPPYESYDSYESYDPYESCDKPPPVSDELPEEFAPTGPKLSRFPIQPAPPIRPRLFADEARFALRLSVMAGATEFAAWAWLVARGRDREIAALVALRLLRPLWSWLGTRVPRTAVAAALLAGGLAACLAPAHLFWLAALPALGDLCASCVGDSVTVERRAAAYGWLDMGQALGAALGFAAGAAFPAAVPAAAAAGLALGFVGVRDLHDRGTPRSTWPLSSYRRLRTPIAGPLALLVLLAGSFTVPVGAMPRWAALASPLAGLALAARIERWTPNAAWLPRIALAVAIAGKLWPPLRPLAAGMAFAAVAASVARGAGEMERPLVSSLAWSALTAGAALGAVL